MRKTPVMMVIAPLRYIVRVLIALEKKKRLSTFYLNSHDDDHQDYGDADYRNLWQYSQIIVHFEEIFPKLLSFAVSP